MEAAAAFPRFGRVACVLRGEPDVQTLRCGPARVAWVDRDSVRELAVVTTGSSSDPTVVLAVSITSSTRISMFLGRRPLAPNEIATLDLAPTTSMVATDGVSQTQDVLVEVEWHGATDGPWTVTLPALAASV